MADDFLLGLHRAENLFTYLSKNIFLTSAASGKIPDAVLFYNSKSTDYADNIFVQRKDFRAFGP